MGKRGLRQTAPARVVAAVVSLLASMAVVVHTAAAASAEPAGCTATWTGGNGAWSDGAHWSPGGVAPLSSDVVCLPAGGYTVDATAANAFAEQVRVGDETDGTQPTLDAGPMVFDTLENRGTLRVHPIETAGLLPKLGGRLLTNRGHLDLLPGVVDPNGGPLLDVALENESAGTVVVSSRHAQFVAPEGVVTRGDVVVEDDGFLDSYEFQQLDGTVRTGDRSAIYSGGYQLIGGRLTGNGVIGPWGLYQTGGTIAPGDPYGSIFISGDYVGTAAAQIEIMPGDTPAAPGSQLTVSMYGTFNGTLLVHAKKPLQHYMAVGVNQPHGAFSSVQGSPAKVSYDPSYGIFVDVQSGFHAVTPARILDTRGDAGAAAVPTSFGPGESRDVAVAGVGGVPASATGVVMNVTAVDPSSATHLTVWPTGAVRPATSNVNVASHQTAPNLVEAKLGGGGKASIFNNAGTVDVLVDVVGYFDDDASGDVLAPLSPARVVDSRDGTGGVSQPWGSGETRSVTVAGVGGVPASGVSAVVANVTAVNPSAASHLSIWPTGVAPPTVSSLNFAAGQTVPNLVVVAVGADGKIDIANNAGTVDVLVDVVGYYTHADEPSRFHGVTPARIVDSRDGTGGQATPWGPGETRAVPVRGVGGVPLNGATAVVVNLTAVNPSAWTHLTVFPAGEPQPASSNLNVRKGDVRPILVVAKVGAGGTISLFNNAGTVDVLVDVVGYYA